jgi:hypothetical protein
MSAQLEIELPPSFKIGRLRFFRHSQVEHLKKVLIAKSIGQTPPAYVEPESDRFVAAPKVAEDLGLSKRTFWRRVREAEDRAAESSGALSL